MCYSVLYNKHGKPHSYYSTYWSEALWKYEDLMLDDDVDNLRIKDREYDMEYRNGQWERSETLIGWCGNR